MTYCHFPIPGKAVLRVNPVSTLPAREKRTILVVGIPRWSTELPPQSVTDCSELDEAAPEPNSSELCLATWQITDWLREVFSEFGQVLYVQLPHVVNFLVSKFTTDDRNDAAEEYSDFVSLLQLDFLGQDEHYIP
ncbi:unnamed protein product [Echinostoma caproni]|uniref:RRM domain-containing protein n=1 Tax=Echinostoma caproni TaxID=27848 RepID=A0A183BBH5_9TREM|nr:unnamed protein product [Echinostoma caproni]